MEIKIRPGENIDTALKRFKKLCQGAGIFAEARRHEYYEKPSVRAKRKSIMARKRKVT